MNKFSKKLFLFLIIITLLAYSTDYIVSSGLRNSNTNTYQAWNDIYMSNIKSKVLIFGGSRAGNQYNPYILDSIDKINSYNLGSRGQQIDYQIIRYNTLRRFNPKPNYIIQNIDFLTLGICNYQYGRVQFLPFVSDDSLMSVIGKVQNINWFDKKIPFIRYFGFHTTISDGFKFFFRLKKLSADNSFKGFYNENNPWNGEELNKMDHIYCEKDSKAIRLFDAYLEQCRKENITVIFVSAPVYMKAMQKIVGYKKLMELYEKFAKKYSITILDYTKDSICMDTCYFMNGTHLNKKGADMFSKKLANDIKSLNIFKSNSIYK